MRSIISLPASDLRYCYCCWKVRIAMKNATAAATNDTTATTITTATQVVVAST
jgi:hypothetical protein